MNATLDMNDQLFLTLHHGLWLAVALGIGVKVGWDVASRRRLARRSPGPGQRA